MGEAKVYGFKTLEVRLNDGGTRTLAGDEYLNLDPRVNPSVPGLQSPGRYEH